MRQLRLTYKVFLSSWLLAAIPAFMIMLLFHPDVDRYHLILQDKGEAYHGVVFDDLNSDGITEALRSGKGIPWNHILVQNNELKVHDQWNFPDDVDPDLSEFFTGNFDHDSNREIYMFTYRDDSLFFNMNEFFENGETKKEREFLSRISSINGKVTSAVYPAGFYDVNGDGFDELYLILHTGFGVDPRIICYYDIKNSTLSSGDFTGMIFQFPSFNDIDADGKPEIFGTMGASGNQKIPVPFTDWSTWLMVYNEQLKFEFSPVEFPGLTNVLAVKSISDGEFSAYVLLHTTGSADTAILSPRVMIYSKEGRLLKERLNSELGLSPILVDLFISDNRILLSGQEVIELDTSLKVTNKLKRKYGSHFFTFLHDIDYNGSFEILLYHVPEKKLVAYDRRFRYMAESDFTDSPYTIKFSTMRTTENAPVTFMNTMETSYIVNLTRNRFHLLGYMAYPGIYIAVVLFIMLIRKITSVQMTSKQELKQKLVTLQLQSVRAQLDPHFTFNTLNSVAALIYLQDKQTAYEYMNKFTRLLRSMIEDADRIYRNLKEEIDFVTTYLELEKLRFGDKFDFALEMGEGISGNEQVPKLVLHTYAENAVKHGLMPKPEGGLLKIIVVREGEYLRLSVEDNGIGRSKSQGQSPSTGKGLKLANEFYSILNQINTKQITHRITDLFDKNGMASGTIVEIIVPVEL